MRLVMKFLLVLLVELACALTVHGQYSAPVGCGANYPRQQQNMNESYLCVQILTGEAFEVGDVYDAVKRQATGASVLRRTDLDDASMVERKAPPASVDITDSDIRSDNERDRFLNVDAQASLELKTFPLSASGSVNFLNRKFTDERMYSKAFKISTTGPSAELVSLARILDGTIDIDPSMFSLSATHFIYRIEYGSDCVGTVMSGWKNEGELQSIQASASVAITIEIGTIKGSAKFTLNTSDKDELLKTSFVSDCDTATRDAHLPADLASASDFFKKAFQNMQPLDPAEHSMCATKYRKVLPKACLGGVVPKKIFLAPISLLAKENNPAAAAGVLSRDLDAEIISKLNDVLTRLDNHSSMIGSTATPGGRLGSGNYDLDGLSAWAKLNEEYRASMVNYTLSLKQTAIDLIHQYRSGAGNGTESRYGMLKIYEDYYQHPKFSPAAFARWWTDTDFQFKQLVSYRGEVTDGTRKNPGVAINSLAEFIQLRFNSTCQDDSTEFCQKNLFVLVIQGNGSQGTIDHAASTMTNQFATFMDSSRKELYDSTYDMQFAFFHYESNCCETLEKCTICDTQSKIPTSSTILRFDNGQLVGHGSGLNGAFRPPAVPDKVLTDPVNMIVNGDPVLRSFHLKWNESKSGRSPDWDPFDKLNAEELARLWRYEVKTLQINVDAYGMADPYPKEVVSQFSVLGSPEVYTRFPGNFTSKPNGSVHMAPAGFQFCTPYQFEITAWNYDLHSEPTFSPQPYTVQLGKLLVLPMVVGKGHFTQDDDYVTFSLNLDYDVIAGNQSSPKNCGETPNINWTSTGLDKCTTNFTNCERTIFAPNNYYSIQTVYMGTTKAQAKPCRVTKVPGVFWSASVVCPWDATDHGTKHVWANDLDSERTWPHESQSFQGKGTYIDDEAHPITIGPSGNEYCLSVRDTGGSGAQGVWLERCNIEVRDPLQRFIIKPVKKNTLHQLFYPNGNKCVVLGASLWVLDDCGEPDPKPSTMLNLTSVTKTGTISGSQGRGTLCMAASSGYELLYAKACDGTHRQIFNFTAFA